MSLSVWKVASLLYFSSHLVSSVTDASAGASPLLYTVSPSTMEPPAALQRQAGVDGKGGPGLHGVGRLADVRIDPREIALVRLAVLGTERRACRRRVCRERRAQPAHVTSKLGQPPAASLYPCGPRHRGGGHVPDELDLLVETPVHLIAEAVLVVRVRVDDVANRLLRYRSDCGKQPCAFARAAAGVDDGNRFLADDEAGVGRVTLVGFAHHVDVANMGVDAGRDLGDRQRRGEALLLCIATAGNQENQSDRSYIGRPTRHRTLYLN